MSRTKDMIKNELLHKFRDIKARAGHTLPLRWLDLTYIPSLNPKEEKLLWEAIDELVSESICELVQSPMPTIRLTQKGEDLIY